MLKKIIVSMRFLVIIFLLHARTPTAFASQGEAEVLNAKAYSLEAVGSIFQPSAHYDGDGAEYAMNNGSAYRMIDTDLKLSYGISAKLETSLFAKIRHVSTANPNGSANNTGPESIGVGGRYAFDPLNALRYSVGLRYRRTLYTNTHYIIGQTIPSNEVILGDDGSEYGVDFYASYLGNAFIFNGKIGYNSPPNDLSSEIIYKAEGIYQWSKLGLIAGVDGIFSLKRDQYTDAPNLKPLLNTGESAQFNSVNREKVAPYLGASYRLDKALLLIKGQTIIAGKSTDKGSLLFAGITWTSEGVTPEAIKIDSFKEYHIDGSVLKVSTRGSFIKIDQGLSTDVEKGAKFDIYQTDYFGGNVLVASGVVYQIGSDWSVIKLIKKYNDIEIKPGFAARGY